MKTVEEMAEDWVSQFHQGAKKSDLIVTDAYLGVIRGFNIAVEMLRSEEARVSYRATCSDPDGQFWADWLERRSRSAKELSK